MGGAPSQPMTQQQQQQQPQAQVVGAGPAVNRATPTSGMGGITPQQQQQLQQLQQQQMQGQMIATQQQAQGQGILGAQVGQMNVRVERERESIVCVCE